MKFNLTDYKKPVKDQTSLPEWAKSETTAALYKETMEIYTEIKMNIESKKTTSIRDRKIVLRQLAMKCGVDPSLLNKRRQPNLIDFINKKNVELETLWVSIIATKYTSGRKLKKTEIEEENQRLIQEVARLTNLRLSEALTTAIENQLTDSQSDLMALVDELKAENEKIRIKNDELSELLRNMIASVDKLRE
jgi:hypothetical protein